MFFFLSEKYRKLMLITQFSEENMFLKISRRLVDFIIYNASYPPQKVTLKDRNIVFFFSFISNKEAF